MSLHSILSLADDLTGALECGAVFAQHGFDACVSVYPTPPLDTLAAVIDTESRHLRPDQAAETVAKALDAAPKARLVYKKTDSTLRGNIAAELRALHEAFPGRPLLYAPAYPALGRTVRQGMLYVHGKPLAETPFAQDPLNPVRDGDVRRLLDGLPVEVLDGETDADVVRAASRVLSTDPPALAAGPTALAASLAERIHPGTRALRLPPVIRCLVVNGSRHPISQAQIDAAQATGVLSGSWTLFDEAIPGEGLARAERLGRRVAQRVQQEAFDTLVVFGGDTARGVHRALGSPVFRSLGELLPGLPVSRASHLLWVTKAGGFGEADVLTAIRARLS